MWDFLLVLGQVPGTSFQITFLELIVFVAALILLWLARKNYIKPPIVSLYWLILARVKKGQQLKLPL